MEKLRWSWLITGATSAYKKISVKKTKGQLISKCLFGAIVSTKKPTKLF